MTEWDKAGKPLRMSGTHLDITERKRAQEALHLTQFSIDNSTDAVFWITSDAKFSYVNSAAFESLGYTEEELLKLTVMDVDFNFTKDLWEEHWVELQEKKSFMIHTIHQRKDKSTFPVEVTVNLIQYGGQEINCVIAKDITERKKAEKSLKESESRLLKAQSVSRMGFLDWNLKTNVIELSEELIKIYGLNPESQWITPDFMTYVVHPDDVELVQKNIELTLKKGKRYNIDHRIIRPDGVILWVHAQADMIFDEDGNQLTLLGTVLDITERKKSEQIQKVLFNISNAVITTDNLEKLISLIQKELGLIIDTKNCFVAFYDETTKLVSLPYMVDERDTAAPFPAGKSMTAYVINSKKTLLATAEKQEKLVKEGKLEFVGSRSKVWLGVPLKVEGKVKGVLAVQSYTDENAYNESDVEILEFMADQISLSIERKKAEELIRKSEERFDLAMQASKDGLYDWDLITDEVYFSASWKKMLGYKDHELENNLSIWETLTHPKEREAFLLKFKNAIENKTTHYEVEFRMRHKLGHWVNILSRANFIYNEDGKALRVVGTHSDMTEVKKAEKELKTALKKAKEADQLKSSFLATMSHELRTPLNAIIGFSDIINKELSIEEVVEFNKTINSSGKHLLTIVEDLFDITLIETGEIKIVKEDVELKLLLNEINDIIQIEQLKTNKEHLSINLIIPPNCNEIILNTDSSKLKQILLNLLKNALKFTRSGHINYGCEIEIIQNESMLKFFVEDTGIGVPKEKHEFIFDIFRQVEDSHTRTYGGTGIGLSISKKLTEFLGGEMWLESLEGKGSTFYFTIPHSEQINELDDYTKIDNQVKTDSGIIIKDRQFTVLVIT